MRHRTKGQSLVEMAFVLPILLLVILGIIDLGYYIYAYATVYQSARNGAEKAAELPPYPNKVNNRSDICVSNIIAAATPSYFDKNITNGITISYPTVGSAAPRRALGAPIQVSITYDIQPLTPLFRFVMFGSNGVIHVSSTAQRSIESLADNPNYVQLVACEP